MENISRKFPKVRRAFCPWIRFSSFELYSSAYSSSFYSFALKAFLESIYKVESTIMYIVADCRLKALEVPRNGRKYKDQ